MSDEALVELLGEAVRLLRVVARPHLVELEASFATNLLTSPKRVAMWKAMDGARNMAESAKEAGVTSEAVRQFLREVEERYPDLIDPRRGSGPQRPSRRMI